MEDAKKEAVGLLIFIASDLLLCYAAIDILSNGPVTRFVCNQAKSLQGRFAGWQQREREFRHSYFEMAFQLRELLKEGNTHA